jgi:hypothetical protein
VTPQIESIGHDLDEAREKLQAARQALEAAPVDDPVSGQAITRLERMEAELGRIEAGIASRHEVPSPHHFGP